MAGRSDVLFVTGSDPPDATLASGTDHLAVTAVEDLDAARDLLSDGGVDCVVVATGLDGDPLDFHSWIRSSVGDVPFVLFGDDADRRTLVEAINHDVDRYVPDEGGAVESEAVRGGSEHLAAAVGELVDDTERGSLPGTGRGDGDPVETASDEGGTPVDVGDGSDRSVPTANGDTAGMDWHRRAVEDADRPLAALDADLVLRVANGPFRERFDLDSAALGRPLSAVVDTDLVGRLGPLFERVLAGESVHVDPADLVDDADRSGGYEAHLYPLGAEPAGIGIAMRDVSDRQWAERRFRRFFQNMPTAGFVLDDRGVTIRVNDTFCERTGYDREEVVGKTLDELPGIMPDADRERTIERFEQLSEGDTLPPAEIEYETSNGQRRYAIVESVPVMRDGEFDRLIGISRDVTELKRRERELARQNERLERFASIVSHDLRNPLQVAAAELELARRGDEKALDNVESALDRMEAIADDVLTMAREGSAVEETDPVSLSSVATECWNHVDTGEATLELEDDAVIAADRSRFQELIENLYRNAVDHAGSDVRIRVGATPEGFFVADDGPGIPEDERESVFDPGYTTADDGTGFGLNIVAEIASAHDWSVSVTDAEDGGARFEFTGVERV